MPSSFPEPQVESPATQAQTFLFADLAGFTAMTVAHGDQAATEMCEHFTSTVAGLVEEADAEVVKTIGDAVLVATRDPAGAVGLGLAIVERLAGHKSPPVRVGMHTGPAISRHGDWFGATVNLASRVSDAARPGEVLLTEATRAALPPGHELQMQARGRQTFKHLPNRVPVFAVIGPGAVGHGLEIDPVCRMAVDPDHAAEASHRHGAEFYFCSDACARAFEAEPLRYVGRSRRARAARAAYQAHLRIFMIAQSAFFGLWLISLLFGGSKAPWFLLLLIGWGIPLVLHYRAVRAVL